jgi:hypothetical protein
MAGNTRGKLKEKFESIHRDFNWCQRHCEDALELIQEHKPSLSDAIKSLHKAVLQLDELAQNIYARL